MVEQFYIASVDKLGLRSNYEGLKWSWGINMPRATRADFDRCDVKVTLEVLDETPPSVDDPNNGKYHYFSGQHGADSIEYRRTFVGKRELWARLSGLVGGDIRLEVNRDYIRFVSHRFMNLHSPGYIMTDVAAWAMLDAGLAPVHCSAFRHRGKTVLILAPPNTGKTLAAMSACLEAGADFLAEDVGITDGRNIFSVPWTSTFRYYEPLDDSTRTKWLNRATKVFPPVELLPVQKSSRVDDLMAAAQLLDSAPVDCVAVLERGAAQSLVDIPVTELYGKAINLNRFEFNYVRSPALVAYEYFNPEVGLGAAMESEHSKLRAVIDSAGSRVVVTSPDATQYSGMLLEHLEKME